MATERHDLAIIPARPLPAGGGAGHGGAARPQFRCEMCGVTFAPVHRRSGPPLRFCSPACQRDWQRANGARSRADHAAIKRAVLDHYSDGAARCAVCGVVDIDRLGLTPGPRQKFPTLPGNMQDFYPGVIAAGFPAGLRVVCRRCRGRELRARGASGDRAA